MTAHASPGLIARYAAGDDLPADAAWALEAHLEGCAACRGRLGDTAGAHDPAVLTVVESAWVAVAAVVQAETPARRRRRPLLLRWLTPAALPWLAATVLVPLVAALLELTTGRSAVLLVAPVVPLLGLAASWSRHLDPAHALVASSPRAGLGLALRRALAGTLLVVPPLVVSGAATGADPARWLLPGFALAAGALALGASVGVGRAAAAVTAGWVCAVAAPGLLWSRPAAVLEPRFMPVWAACAVLAAGAVYLRRDAFQRAATR
ncbi:zf-HC2 domain-containing protein [Dactylosporangium aurantiacum]|uniref:Zf-HC2 domain-containing protein n=1 Tax=Dactylosporangium aurantiacum TaxID=35754 RepID=A0A9Q9IRC1_9ACTN|nr:zf-HC2 domain-containing protein [Dactylosporangium aurantiacum]MDG6105864.1 zf-HC2 domain-containing protein [Dactylosporangium aurantiacum]UWZ57960.1 zf-HC2 domain-containing protein [Dactylosporangium aurantiacum]